MPNSALHINASLAPRVRGTVLLIKAVRTDVHSEPGWDSTACLLHAWPHLSWLRVSDLKPQKVWPRLSLLPPPHFRTPGTRVFLPFHEPSQFTPGSVSQHLWSPLLGTFLSQIFPRLVPSHHQNPRSSVTSSERGTDPLTQLNHPFSVSSFSILQSWFPPLFLLRTYPLSDVIWSVCLYFYCLSPPYWNASRKSGAWPVLFITVFPDPRTVPGTTLIDKEMN